MGPSIQINCNACFFSSICTPPRHWREEGGNGVHSPWLCYANIWTWFSWQAAGGHLFSPLRCHIFFRGRRGRREEGDCWHMVALLFSAFPVVAISFLVWMHLEHIGFSCSSCHGFVWVGGCRCDVFYKTSCIDLCLLIFMCSTNYACNWNPAFFHRRKLFTTTNLKASPFIDLARHNNTMGCRSSASFTPIYSNSTPTENLDSFTEISARAGESGGTNVLHQTLHHQYKTLLQYSNIREPFVPPQRNSLIEVYCKCHGNNFHIHASADVTYGNHMTGLL